MNLLDFGNQFKDEAGCRSYLKEKREAAGVVCRKCGGREHYWLTPLGCWKCKGCSAWTNLRAGTIMEKSKMPVRMWFMCIHLMTSTKKAFSALEMQKQLGHKRYEPVWYMMQKIRRAMGKRDGNYLLHGEIEMDDAFFEIVDLQELDELGNKKGEEEELKRGRGSQRQMKVLVMVESAHNPSQADPHKKNRAMGFVKMKAMDDLSAVGINYEVRKGIDNPRL